MYSTFSDDLKTEKIISNFLDTYFYERIIPNKYERVKNLEEQNLGIDLKIKGKNKTKTYKFDEKVAHQWVNYDLKTFAFELSYIKDNETKGGWLFNNKYSETDYYILGYVHAEGIADKEWKNITENNINKIELLIVKKEKIQSYLEKKNPSLNSEDYLTVSEEIRQYLTPKKETKLNRNNLNWNLSLHLKEKPLNILIPKNELTKICEKHYLVTRNEVKEI